MTARLLPRSPFFHRRIMSAPVDRPLRMANDYALPRAFFHTS